MAGFDEENFSSVAVITLNPDVINSIIRLCCIVLKHFDGCRISDKQAFFPNSIVSIRKGICRT